jgi:hypothetical protein
MRYTSRVSKRALAAMATACCFAMAIPGFAADPAPGAVTGTWQKHKDSFYYYGLTALFSCSSIEDHVKQILLYLGARKDAHVDANGCPHGTLTPGRTANVHAEFYTLAPADDSTAPGAISAQWTPLVLNPKHPIFMGDGDCELIKAMKDFLPRNFALRDVQYTTDCVPYELTLNGFSVKAEVLKATPPVKVSRLTK